MHACVRVCVCARVCVSTGGQDLWWLAAVGASFEPFGVYKHTLCQCNLRRCHANYSYFSLPFPGWRACAQHWLQHVTDVFAASACVLESIGICNCTVMHP